LIDGTIGLISWTPTAEQEGDHDVVVQVSNTAGSATQNFSVAVVDPAPHITSSPVTDATVGFSYSYDVNATGIPAPIYSLTSKPTGMSIDETTGEIAWTPVAGQEGNHSVVVVATNTAGTDDQDYEISVADAPECIVVATSPGDLTSDDLICSYDLVGDMVTAATAWYKNGSPLMTLYLPMEGGITNALLDYSSNGNDAAASGSPTWDASGGHDGKGAFLFDGSDHMIIPDDPSLDVDYVTLMAWIYLDEYVNDQRIISKEYGVTQPYSIYTLNMNGPEEKHLEMRIGPVGERRIRVRTDVEIPLHEWVHVAGSFDGSQIVLYINGQAVKTAPASGVLRHNDEPVYVGGSQFWTPRFLHGRIDDARIYGYALSLEQVEAYHDHGRDLMVLQETSVGDEWQAHVTPFSATEAGDQCETNILTIQPSTSAGSSNIGQEVPEEYGLSANFPNPFNPSTEIGFSLPAASHVRLEIFNIVGQRVITLIDGRREAGYHSVVWDGRNVASGMYLYRLEADGFVSTKKMILLK